MPDHTKLTDIASKQHGIVSHEQLADCGFDKDHVYRRVKSGVWHRVSTRVVSLIGEPMTWDQRMTAAGLGVDGRGALSHRVASRLWRFRSIDEEIDVSVLYPGRIVLPGAVVHRSRDLDLDEDITRFNGLPVTTPVRTICDLGLIFPRSEVERVLQHAIAGPNPLVTRKDAWAFRRRVGVQGRDGAGDLDWCLERLPADAERAESGPEVRLLQICEEHDLPAPVCQLPVVVGGRRFRLDFAYPSIMVFIEVDGSAEHSGEQIAKDDGRQNSLVAAGWHPIRFTYGQLRDSPAWCASVIQDVCAPRFGADDAA